MPIFIDILMEKHSNANINDGKFHFDVVVYIIENLTYDVGYIFCLYTQS